MYLIPKILKSFQHKNDYLQATGSQKERSRFSEEKGTFLFAGLKMRFLLFQKFESYIIGGRINLDEIDSTLQIADIYSL